MNSTSNKDSKDWSVASDVYAQVSKKITSKAAIHAINLSDQKLSLKSPDVHVLDDGCGPGAITIELCKRYPDLKILATDFSPSMLKKTQQLHLPNVTTLLADGNDLGEVQKAYPDGFTHVLSNFMNQFSSTPSKVLQEMISVARKGGIVSLGSWGIVEMELAFIQIAHEIDPSWSSPGCWATKDWPEDTDELKLVFEREGLVDVQCVADHCLLANDTEQGVLDYFFEGKNPGFEKFQRDFEKSQGKDQWVKLKECYLESVKRNGWNPKEFRLQYFITVGRKP